MPSPSVITIGATVASAANTIAPAANGRRPLLTRVLPEPDRGDEQGRRREQRQRPPVVGAHEHEPAHDEEARRWSHRRPQQDRGHHRDRDHREREVREPEPHRHREHADGEQLRDDAHRHEGGERVLATQPRDRDAADHHRDTHGQHEGDGVDVDERTRPRRRMAVPEPGQLRPRLVPALRVLPRVVLEARRRLRAARSRSFPA